MRCNKNQGVWCTSNTPDWTRSDDRLEHRATKYNAREAGPWERGKNKQRQIPPTEKAEKTKAKTKILNEQNSAARGGKSETWLDRTKNNKTRNRLNRRTNNERKIQGKKSKTKKQKKKIMMQSELSRNVCHKDGSTWLT